MTRGFAGIAISAVALALMLIAGPSAAIAGGGGYQSCGKVSGERGTVKVSVKKTSCKEGKQVAKGILSVGANPPDLHGYSCSEPKGAVITCKKGSKRIKTKLVSGRAVARIAAKSD